MRIGKRKPGSKSRLPRIRRPRLRKAFDDARQLLLPLFCKIPELQSKEPAPQWVEWAEEEWIKLHGGLLDTSLEQLANPSVKTSTKAEIIAWLAEPIDTGKVPQPFSFQACCQLYGFDPEELQYLALQKAQEVEATDGKTDVIRTHLKGALQHLYPGVSVNA